jgi:hypothetical protein
MLNEKVEKTSINLEEKYKDVFELFKEKGCIITKISTKSEPIEYICICGKHRKQKYSDFIRRNCRWCRDKKLTEIPIELDVLSEKKTSIELDVLSEKEIWKPIVGGWISNLGNAKNSLEKLLKLCDKKSRYHIGGKHQYASILVANAFQIENYEKLKNKEYVVSHIDENKFNNNLNNLKIITKSENNKKNGNKTRSSETFKEKVWWNPKRFENIKIKVINELSKHTLYYNGEIWNGERFLTGSLSDNYLSVLGYKIHRLICYAFNPIEGKEKLSDYEELQVNHKDGNTLNNHADNLEWVTPSENMKHSYSEKLNKKTRGVLQYNLEGEFIKEFISISEASRQTEEPEHRIRTIAQGKTNTKALFLWKFKNHEETEEYTKKFSKS